MDTENKLILTVGLPLSGKSHWAKHHGAPIVNPDAIRLALHGRRFIQETEGLVWVLARYMVEALFLSGHDSVILDACNTTQMRRDEWQSSRWKRLYVIMDVHAEVCRDRAIAVDDGEILPIIDKMAFDLEFDGIYYGKVVSDDMDMMAKHIEFPGRNEHQIFHIGTAND